MFTAALPHYLIFKDVFAELKLKMKLLNLLKNLNNEIIEGSHTTREIYFLVDFF